MLPPHWLCKNCGIIITDSGSEPRFCSWCGHSEFADLGYQGDYDGIEARAEHGVFFDPSKFLPEMQKIYWEKFTGQQRLMHQREIDELNDRIREAGFSGF